MVWDSSIRAFVAEWGGKGSCKAFFRSLLGASFAFALNSKAEDLKPETSNPEAQIFGSSKEPCGKPYTQVLGFESVLRVLTVSGFHESC